MIPDLQLDMPSHYSQEVILSTALGFPISKRITDLCSILVREAVVFSQELLPPCVQRKFSRNAEMSRISTA